MSILSVLQESPVTSIAKGDGDKALDNAKNPSRQGYVLTEVKDLLKSCVQANKADPIYENIKSKITVKDVLGVFNGNKGERKSLNQKKVDALKDLAKAKIGSSRGPVQSF
jgi:hypothetical protein